MVYVILGMHKSGTTLVAETLNASGIAMGDGMAPGADYDRGHKYERRAIKAINKSLLGFDESYRLPTGEIEADAETKKAIRRAVVDANVGNRSADWGFKDPRTVLTWKLWREELPERRLILVHRSPQAVWRHYRRFGPRGPMRRVRWWWSVLSAWRSYNWRLVRIAGQESQADWMSLRYEDLMGDKGSQVLKELGRFVDRQLPDLRRADRQRSPSGFSGAVWLYDLLTGFDVWRLKRALERLDRS